MTEISIREKKTVIVMITIVAIIKVLIIIILTLSLTLTSAPFDTRKVTMFMCPLPAAVCSGVHPPCVNE